MYGRSSGAMSGTVRGLVAAAFASDFNLTWKVVIENGSRSVCGLLLRRDPHGASPESQCKSRAQLRPIFFFHPVAFKQSLTRPAEKRKAPAFAGAFCIYRGPEHGKQPVAV